MENGGGAVGRVVQPVLAGVVTAVVGFASTFAVVLAGLRAVGAEERHVVHRQDARLLSHRR